MYLLAEQTVSIDCSVARAYAYATDLEHFSDWFPGVRAIRSTDALPAGSVGKAYLERVSIPMRGERDVRIVVVDSRPDRAFATESQFRPLLPRMEMHFADDGTGRCRLDWRMFSRNRGVLARMMLLPLARAVLRRRAEQGIATLRQRLQERGVG